jgi:hypothetical protein
MDRRELERRVAEFHRAYMNDPDFLDRLYRVPSLAELLGDQAVIGVARYIECPSFEPERLFTFVYRFDSIEIGAVVGATSLWSSVPTVYQVVSTDEWEVEEGEAFDADRAWRRVAVVRLPSQVCPPPLESWTALRVASTNAGNCSTNTFDGICYRHRLADREFRSNADWYNPEAPEHTLQLALIEAYAQFLSGVGLYTQ